MRLQIHTTGLAQHGYLDDSHRRYSGPACDCHQVPGSGSTTPLSTSESRSTKPQATSARLIPNATPTPLSISPQYIPGPFTFNVVLPLQPAGTPTPRAEITQSIYDSDVDLQRAYRSGWGTDVSQTQTVSQTSVTLKWAGSDTNWIFLVFDVAPPAGWTHGYFTDAAAIVTLPDGSQLASGTGSCNKVEVDGAHACVIKYGRPASLRSEAAVMLDIEIPKLSTVGDTPPNEAVDVPGPFKFNESVPLYVPANAPTPTPLTSDSPLPSRAYVEVNGYVDVIDARTAALLHQIPLHLATQSPFIASDAKGDRLFVTDAGWPNQSGDILTVYRTTDWSIERQVPVTDIIRYIGQGTGITASTDGRYAYVYNYNDRTRGSGPVDYWLSTYDVKAGKWLDKSVDLAGCGNSQLMAGASNMVYVHCSDTGDLRVIDPASGSVVRTIPLGSRAVSLGQDVYSVGSDGGIQVLNTTNGGIRTVPHQGADNLNLSVPDIPFGITPDGGQVIVPFGTAGEVENGTAHAFAVIDVQTGKTDRTVQADQTFNWVTFSPDGSTAFLEIGKGDDPQHFLEQIDLRDGTTTAVLQAPIAPQMVIAP